MPAKWRLLYSLNPMVGVIDGFRWSLLRGQNHSSGGPILGDLRSLSYSAVCQRHLVFSENGTYLCRCHLEPDV